MNTPEAEGQEMAAESDPTWQTLDAATMGRQTHTSLSLMGDGGPAAGGALEPGSVINGRYSVARAIAHGGMGWVYDVKDALHPARAVALKVVRGLSDSPAKLSLFKAEFSTMAKLEHPNVARVYDFEELQGGSDFLITMERVDGEPLHRALRDSKDWQVIIPHIVQVCRALSYVHSRRIVHFDLKPANILVDGAGAVKVVDFGIAGAEPASHQGGIMGTPQYMAPELLLGTGSADHRADVYALGVTLFELLTGDVPCPKRDIWELARWLNEGGVRVAPTENIPAWLAKLIEKLCAKEPADRHRSANAVLQEINAGSGFTYELETAETRQSYVMTPRFSGRGKEHAQVMDFITERLSGRGLEPALMLSGVSGIGKSRLMKEVRHAAQLQRWVFLEANCYEKSLVEYGPIADMLNQLVPLIETLGGVDIVQVALPELVKLAPQLARGRSYEPAPRAANAEGERARLLETSAEFFVQAARIVPFALYVNDMQWAARGPAELFAYLAQRVRDDQSQGDTLKLALIASYRSDEVDGRALEDTLKRLRKEKLSLGIELAALAAHDIDEVIRSMLGIDDVPSEFLARVTHETAGNPFFVQEVMRALFENGSVFLEDGKWATMGSIGELQIPATMAEVFRRRFDLLSAEQKDVVRILAVHGRPLAVERIYDVLGSAMEAMAALVELEERQIVVRQTGRALAYNIAHDRMRETIYGDLTEHDRRGWHKRIGEKIEAATDGVEEKDRPLDELARHFREARVDAKAREYSLAAGMRALERFANESAADHLAHAVALFEENDPMYAPAAEAQADALTRLPNYDEAVALYLRIGEMFRDKSSKARIARKIAAVYKIRNQLEEARDEAWKAAELLGDARPSGVVGWILATLSELVKLALMHLGVPGLGPRRENASELSIIYNELAMIYLFLSPHCLFYLGLRSWRVVARSHDLSERAFAMLGPANLLGMLGLRTLSWKLFDASIRDAIASGSPRDIGWALCVKEVTTRSAGLWRPAVVPLERSIQELRKAGDSFRLGSAHVLLVDALLYLGDIAGARRSVAGYNRESFRITDTPTVAKLTVGQEATCLSYLEEVGECDHMFAQAARLSMQSRDLLGYATMLTRDAQSLFIRGRHEEALLKFEQCLALYREQRFFDTWTAEILFFLPRAYLRTSVLSRARGKTLRQVQAQAMRQTRWLHKNWRPPTLVNRALIEERRGKQAKADRYFAEALAIARQHEAGFFISDTLYEWGCVLRQRNDLECAAARLDEAREIAINGSNRWLQRRCDAELAAIHAASSIARAAVEPVVDAN